MRNAVLITTAGILVTGFTVTNAPAAHAQFTGRYENPFTHRVFNNRNSSLLDTAILNTGKQLLLASSFYSMNEANQIAAAQMKRGQQAIKGGRASTRYAQRSPFPTDIWLKRIPADQHRQWASEASLQKSLWDQEARARGANMNDMADVLGVTFVMGWEAQTGGQKPTNAQYRGIAGDFRKMLLSNAYVQGMSQADRQLYIEGQLLNASDPVRLLREAKRTGDTATLQKAREDGKKIIDGWLPKGYSHYVPTAAGFKETK